VSKLKITEERKKANKFTLEKGGESRFFLLGFLLEVVAFLIFGSSSKFEGAGP
jgi:hypothetical protein